MRWPRLSLPWCFASASTASNESVVRPPNDRLPTFAASSVATSGEMVSRASRFKSQPCCTSARARSGVSVNRSPSVSPNRSGFGLNSRDNQRDCVQLSINKAITIATSKRLIISRVGFFSNASRKGNNWESPTSKNTTGIIKNLTAILPLRGLILPSPLTGPPRPRWHGCLVGPEPTASGSGITLGTGQPRPETPMGRAPCDALPSVRLRVPRAAQVSDRGDAATSANLHRQAPPVPSPTSMVRARQPDLRDENRRCSSRPTGRS